MKKMKLSELKEGDLFKWGPNVWDGLTRFVKVTYYNDRTNKWVENAGKSTRTCIWIKSAFKDQGFMGGFTWRNGDPDVYVPQFPICIYKKHYGKRCIPSENGQNNFIFPFELNEINHQ